jgi:hypothetical protein
MATKRKSDGWLAWWAAPVGSGRGRSRGRTRGRSRGGSGSWGPGSLSWWLATPGSKPPARYGPVSAPPRERVRGRKGTCTLCGKGAGCRCKMVSGEPIKRPRRPRGSAPYANPPDFRAQGAVWCGRCRHRINTYTGHCLNRSCPR